MIRHAQHPSAHDAQRRQGFTLTELMIAVVLLVVVIVGTSRIFATASKVTGIGRAASDVLQEAASIERRIRADLESLSPEGFIAIRCVALPNDVNTPGPLLNPQLPPAAIIRADQILFYTQGVQSVQGWSGRGFTSGGADDRKAQGTISRVYYGHAFQLPEGPPATVVNPTTTLAADVAPVLGSPLVPWFSLQYGFSGQYPVVNTLYVDGVQTYTSAPVGPIYATQPPAAHWLLARQAIILGDDRDDHAVDPTGGRFLDRHSAWSIVHPVVLNGRVDVAVKQLNDLRLDVLDGNPADGTLDGWAEQRETIATALFYPRAERQAPSMARLDQALTGNVLGDACSSFIIDWTYENGVGATTDYRGVYVASGGRQPWFGFDVSGDPIVTRGVQTFTDYVADQDVTDRPETVFPENLESYSPPGAPLTPTGLTLEGAGAVVYEAIFGYNQDMPLDAAMTPGAALGYTPWPSALRITMVLHDAESKMEEGRELQFVVHLPTRK